LASVALYFLHLERSQVLKYGKGLRIAQRGKEREGWKHLLIATVIAGRYADYRTACMARHGTTLRSANDWERRMGKRNGLLSGARAIWVTVAREGRYTRLLELTIQSSISSLHFNPSTNTDRDTCFPISPVLLFSNLHFLDLSLSHSTFSSRASGERRPISCGHVKLRREELRLTGPGTDASPCGPVLISRLLACSLSNQA
jgi:hypothetical protein